MNRRGFNRNNRQREQRAEQIGSQFGTVFTTRQQAKYMTGARTILKVNGSVIAFAFRVSWDVRTVAEEIYTIDSTLPWEIAPKRIEVSGTLGLFQVPGQSPQALNIQSDVASFLIDKYITIEVKDSATDAILFSTGSAIITGQQGTLNSEQLGSVNLTWKAVGWQAENPPKAFKAEDLNSNPSDIGNPLLNSIKSKFGF